MRIYDHKSDATSNNIVLFLKLDEAKELYHSLGSIIEKKSLHDHAHINDLEYKHEITITLYAEDDMEMLNERAKKVILEDV